MKSVNRFLFLVFVLFFSSKSVFAQLNVINTLNNAIPGGTAGWVKVGTLGLPQLGFTAFIRFYGGSGYNAQNSQNGYVELFMRTSNTASTNAGYGFSASATAYGENVSGFASLIRIVPNAAGTAATAYDIYFMSGVYLGFGFYEVTSGTSATWTHSATNVTPGTGYDVPMSFRTGSDTYLAKNALFVSAATGNVGIGVTTGLTAKLSVKGEVRAQKVKVTQAGWPDYVFDSAYNLKSLREVETFVKNNQHLPEIPSAKEVSENGLDLGDMQARLLRKIEELTLHMIEQEKKIASQEEKMKTQELRIAQLEGEKKKK